MAQPFYKNNPLAPPWLWSDTNCPEPGKLDRYHQYVLRQDVSTSQRLTDQPFLFDGDGCFVIRLMAAGQQGGGEYYIQWRDENGRYISNQPLTLGSYNWPLAVTQAVAPGLRWSFNLEEVGAASGGRVFFVLIGVKQLGAR